MRKLLPFLACLMLVLTGWTGIAHAAEGVACIEAPQANAAMEMAGDCDEVPADADKAYPHHHGGCHGHHVGVPIASDSTGPASSVRVTASVWRNAPKAPVASDPALRPPQA